MVKLISSGVAIGSKAKLEHPVRVFGNSAIQDGAEIGRYTIVDRHAMVTGRARIGRYCSIGRAAEVGLYEFPLNLMSNHGFQYNSRHFDSLPGYRQIKRNYKAELSHTYIGHDVMIDAKAIVKAGAAVGTGAVIGAGSVVVSEVPPYAIAEGVPSRIVGYRFEEDIIEKFLESQWWDLTPMEMEGMAFDDPLRVIDQIAEAHEKKKKAKSAEEPVNDDDPILVSLRQSLAEMGLGEKVIALVMKDKTYIANTFDMTNKDDKVILQDKLAYLQDFIAERGQSKLSVNEKKHISSLFRQRL